MEGKVIIGTFLERDLGASVPSSSALLLPGQVSNFAPCVPTADVQPTHRPKAMRYFRGVTSNAISQSKPFPFVT